MIDAPTFGATATQVDQGRVTRISGKTPKSVLDVYCAARGPSESCKAQEVVPSQPPRADAMIGLLGRPDEPGMRFALGLRRDERSGEWFAGNGADPLEAQPF